MVFKKLDVRIKNLIEYCVKSNNRSLFFLIGPKAKDQVCILHNILVKTKLNCRPSCLWCYKKELGFSNNRQKKFKKLNKKLSTKQSLMDGEDQSPFEMFISTTKIRYCFYSDTQSVLGQTYGMLILQDFETITPNLLARTIETIEGGGIVCVLLDSIDNLKQLASMSMDVHSKYQTQVRKNISHRFNKRLILSIGDCATSICLDDQLNVISCNLSQELHAKSLKQASSKGEDTELATIKTSLSDTPCIGDLINLCVTTDQAKCFLRFIDVLSEKSLNQTISMTSARGRGKSACLGIALGGAVHFGYSNVFITSPTPTNIQTIFQFICKALDALNFQEHVDYNLIESTDSNYKNCIVCIKIFRNHKQTIQYVDPLNLTNMSQPGSNQGGGVLGQCEILVIDEAAAIPLPIVQKLFGNYLIFLSSTISGYEGTGRSLSLKLLNHLRSTSANAANSKNAASLKAGQRKLFEVVLNESIRYANNDHCEKWLNQLLCLDATDNDGDDDDGNIPNLDTCQLFNVSRDALFSYSNGVCEKFLHKMIGLYVSAHYKNTPNDLQMLCDAPGHMIFVLLSKATNEKSTPQILVVIHACVEGGLSKSHVSSQLGRGRRSSGDLIPWTLASSHGNFEETLKFSQKTGLRIIRIATQPKLQRMGYAKKALQLLVSKLLDVSSGGDAVGSHKPIDNERCLLSRIDEWCMNGDTDGERLLEENEKVDYLGVSFGLTHPLLMFWRQAGCFSPIYLRQIANDITGEYSCIMLKGLNPSTSQCVENLSTSFKYRLVRLLSFPKFREFASDLALALLLQSPSLNDPHKDDIQPPCVTPDDESSGKSAFKECLSARLSKTDISRLDLYAKQQTDLHVIVDLLPILGESFFNTSSNGKRSESSLVTSAIRHPEMSVHKVQQIILIGLGLQRKSAEEVAKEVDLPATQVLGLTNRFVKKVVTALNAVPTPVDESLDNADDSSNKATGVSIEEMEDELSAEGKKVLANLQQYQIKGNDSDWNSSLKETPNLTSFISVKSIDKKRKHSEATLSGSMKQFLPTTSDACDGVDEFMPKKDKKKKKKRH